MDEAQIRQLLPDACEAELDRLELFDEIGSTSSYLLEQPAPSVGKWHIAIANRQTAGRGRGDKQWYSPSGGGLWMSGAYTFESLPETLSALTLAVGVGSAQALRELGVRNLRLKWPNDLLVGGRKLGGVLLDSSSSHGSNLTVVCGLGINTDIGGHASIRASTLYNNDLQPVDLREVLQERPPMPELAAAMIDSFVTVLQLYAVNGFTAFAEDWRKLDWLLGRRIVVTQQQQTRGGVADGIAANGALIVRDGAESHHIVSGTVRLLDDAGAGE